jgi:FkbM family methyltransferase
VGDRLAGHRIDPRTSVGKRVPDIIPLGDRTVAVRLACGAYVVVPTWNIDVNVGIIRDGIIEPWTSRAIEALLKPGHSYVNLGANFGYYMVLGAHCVGRAGRVVAVEANRLLLPWLMRSVYWAGYPDVIRLYNCAVSDVDDLEVDLMFDPQFAGGASVAARVAADQAMPTRFEEALWENVDLAPHVAADGLVTPAVGHFVRVKSRTRRLDTLLSDAPGIDVLHMDIEGSEPAAILGAVDLIRRSPALAIVMEWSPYYFREGRMADQRRAMCDLLDGLGYRWYRIRPEDFAPDLPAPRLEPIARRDALLATPHADLLLVKDLAFHHPGWPQLVVGG